MRKLFLLLILALIFCGTVNANTYQVTYIGKDLIDENVGIIITTGKDHRFFGVTNPDYHYASILPYNTPWVFEKNDQYILFGTNQNKDVSIDIYPKDAKNDVEFLDAMKQNILEKQEVLGVEKAETLIINGVSVLKTISDVGKATKNDQYTNLKQQYFYITKTNSNVRGVLHFSMIMEPGSQADLDHHLDYLSRSFIMNFMGN